MIPLDRVIMSKDMLSAAADALANEDLLFGESVTRFEGEFAAFCRTDYAVSVNSGLDSLVFSLLSVGVKNKRVLTTPSSFIATASCAFHAGGMPEFCDIRAADNGIDPLNIRKALAKRNGKKAGAIIPVHLHGFPAEMESIMEISDRYGVPVIEDACQAHGAIFAGKRAGAIGHAAAFSFNPFKNMTVGGDGGMVTTNDARIAENVRMLGDSGRKNPYTHEHEVVGYTSRLNSVKAAIGRVQLRKLEAWNERRREIAALYSRGLEGIDGLTLPSLGSEGRIVPVFNKYAVKTERREGLKKHLEDQGIQCDAHYPIPIHLQPPFRRLGYKEGDFPEAERFAATTLSLPMYVEMNGGEIRAVCDAIRGFFGQG